MRANKQGKQYRYYVSQNCVQNKNHPKGVISRLPAHEIETLILNALVAEIKDVNKLSGMLGLDIESGCKTLEHVSKGAEELPDIHKAIHKIVVDTNRITAEVCVKSLAKGMSEFLGVGLAIADDDRIHSLSIPYHTKRARRGAVVIRPGEGKDVLDLPKSKLEDLVKGIIWRDAHFNGKSFIEIANENDCSRSLVLQLVRQSFEIA